MSFVLALPYSRTRLGVVRAVHPQPRLVSVEDRLNHHHLVASPKLTYFISLFQREATSFFNVHLFFWVIRRPHTFVFLVSLSSSVFAFHLFSLVFRSQVLNSSILQLFYKHPSNVTSDKMAPNHHCTYVSLFRTIQVLTYMQLATSTVTAGLMMQREIQYLRSI